MYDDHSKIDSFTKGFVRKQARKLAGKFGFKQHDQDEIEQQLYLRLLKHLPKANPDCPKWKAFVSTTVRRHIASMIRDNQAEKRDYRCTSSLHVSVGDEDDPAELAGTICQCDVPSRRCQAQRSSQEQAELRLDIAGCLEQLEDDRLREFCELLQDNSVAQASREMNVPRTTLQDWLRKLRIRFEQRGLKEYL